MIRRRSLAGRLHDALLRLLPREFRGDFGEAMTADFDERRRSEGDGAALRREAGSILACAVREHAGILRRDVVDAVRLVRRTPGFSALAVLMLALGTGANVAMFSVIDAVMLRSPFPDRERMAYVSVMSTAATPTPLAPQDRPDSVAENSPRWTTIVPTDRFIALEETPGAFAAVGALGSGTHLLTSPGDAQRPDFECVTAGMFDVFGTPPRYGRVFGPDEDRPGAPPTIVLSDSFARTLGDPARLVGTTLTLNRFPVTIIGIMPPGLSGIYTRVGTSGWLPARVRLKDGELAGCSLGEDVAMFVRVRPGMTRSEAEAATPGLRLEPVDELTYGTRRLPLFILAAAVVCVLLIACINVGGLQLERSLSRRREYALRVALGASRSRLVRHALTESTLLALAGAAAALAMTRWLHGTLLAILPWNLPNLEQVAVDGRSVLAAIAVACGASLITALLPVLQSRRIDPAVDLASSRPTSTARSDWMRSGLVVVEIALSIVVLIGAGLMIRTFATLRPTQPGFDPQGKLVTVVEQPVAANQRPAGEFVARAIERLRALAGVRGVEGASYIPLSGSFTPARLSVDGSRTTAYGSAVTAGYFALMNIRVLRGRAFSSSDTAESPRVVVVNERLARRLRPDGAVIGLTVRAIPPSSPRSRPAKRGEPVDWRIVGVVGDTRTVGRDIEGRPEVYMTLAQVPLPAIHVVIQTPRWSDPAAVDDIRRAIGTLHHEMVVEPVEVFMDYLDRHVATQRFGAWLLSIFAGLAVLLAAVGLMTTMGWWVRQKSREIGVRVALGASPSRVIRFVIGRGLSIALVGIAGGCLAASWLMRYLEGWIYGVTPLDATTFARAAFGMALAATAAICLPMRRALRVDPIVALREE